jgi:pyruvate dehydrogenase E2 component (dihydrolipoyllysine-residue acetyltransferase)
MPVEIVIPQAAAGEGMELTLASWLKVEGDHVRAGEPLFELDTDKTTIEIEAVAEGMLTRVCAYEGDRVEPLQVVAYIVAPGEELPAATTFVAEPQLRTVALGPAAGATPRAKELAQEHGIDLSTVTGRGPGGFITTKDVEAVIARRGEA